MTRRMIALTASLLAVAATPVIGLQSAGAAAGNTLLCAFSKTPLGELEAKIGRKFGSHRIYHKWDSQFPGEVERDDVRAGRVPFITWKAHRRGGPVKWAAIASGKEDATIRARATGLKALGKPVLLSFHHEPENDAGKNGSASDYVAAFRHVAQVFDGVGANNVRMVWGPIMVYTFQGAHGGPNVWYPGPEYVDYVGVNGYNWYPGRSYTKWRSFRDTFSVAYNWSTSRGKPMVIAETGVQEDPKVPGRKAQWLKDALATAKGWPQLKALCYFNSDTIYPWWVTSTSSALSAYKAMGQDPWMQA